jgi:hypothetical protein
MKNITFCCRDGFGPRLKSLWKGGRGGSGEREDEPFFRKVFLPLPRFFALLLCLFLPSAPLWAQVDYVCKRVTEPIVIDGKLDEWERMDVLWTPAFADMVDGSPAWFDSRGALAHDEDFLYIAMRAEEPFVRGKLRERDAKIYTENDLEVFIAGEDSYYEFEINALGTVYDVFWIWRDAYGPGKRFSAEKWPVKGRRTMTLSGIGDHVHPRGERIGWIDYDLPGLRSAVAVIGSLNDDTDRDEAWTMELALPWRSLGEVAEGRSLPPKSGDVWRIDCSRFQYHDKDGKPLPHPVGWTWTLHGEFDSHMPEVFPRVRFSSEELKGR